MIQDSMVRLTLVVMVLAWLTRGSPASTIHMVTSVIIRLTQRNSNLAPPSCEHSGWQLYFGTRGALHDSWAGGMRPPVTLDLSVDGSYNVPRHTCDPRQ
ncbi:hypothetical protein FPV67DRAFT_250962 [Lyophyllum atratum]|nr:hypothetical protein FPV67DRAFT_250962 [Lyophyllum atratum]